MSTWYDCTQPTTTAGCNENCADSFYKAECWSPLCKQYTYDKPLYCPINQSCFIKLWDTLYLRNTHDLCKNLEGRSTTLSVDCWTSHWFKIKIWIGDKIAPCNFLSSDVSFARCKCKVCHDCGFRVYCSCRANEYVETTSSSTVTTRKIASSTDSTSPATTTPEIGTTVITSPDVNRTVPYNISEISSKPVAIRKTDNCGVAGIATGGAVCLLHLVLVILLGLWCRKKRLKTSIDRHINSQPSVSFQTYDSPDRPFIPQVEENYVQPRDTDDYVNSLTTLANGTGRHSKISGEKQTEDYDLTKPDSDNVYENSLDLLHLQSEHNDPTKTTSEESDYNTLNQEGSDTILDHNDDQYQHVKNVPNSNGQEDYDELARPFEKQKNYPIEDDYDHCKVPSRQHGDDEDDYDHLN